MKKNEKNEELQSRREFFKKVAKGALPILGAIVLANAPAVINAAEKAPMGCRYSCEGDYFQSFSLFNYLIFPHIFPTAVYLYILETYFSVKLCTFVGK